MTKPAQKPQNPNFSSGPCSKRPGWTLDALSGAFLGRSHRAADGKAKLKQVIDQHKKILGIPEGYVCGIVPASDTGAVEMALWSMLGARGVDVLGWDVFGKDWCKDVSDHLKLENARVLNADFGQIVDLASVNFDNDVIFTWNGTTSGVRVPNGEWIPADRAGLTICDATSAVFAYDMPWDKLDVVTWSWQKVLGGEAAHGMLVLSPRAVERLETFKPDRPLPKIFRMTAKGKLSGGIFEGETINTPSMLAVEDCLDALKWVESIGGVKATIQRSTDNFAVLADWVARTDWADFLAEKPETRSTTSVCLKFTDPQVAGLSIEEQQAFVKGFTKRLEKEAAAFDIASHRDAAPGLRIWCGATVESADVTALLPWLEWAFAETVAQDLKKAA